MVGQVYRNIRTNTIAKVVRAEWVNNHSVFAVELEDGTRWPLEEFERLWEIVDPSWFAQPHDAQQDTGKYLAVYTPVTLAAMAADISVWLAEEFDGTAVSAAEWDKVNAYMSRIINTLVGLVGDEDAGKMLAAAHADMDYCL